MSCTVTLRVKTARGFYRLDKTLNTGIGDRFDDVTDGPEGTLDVQVPAKRIGWHMEAEFAGTLTAVRGEYLPDDDGDTPCFMFHTREDRDAFVRTCGYPCDTEEYLDDGWFFASVSSPDAIGQIMSVEFAKRFDAEVVK